MRLNGYSLSSTQCDNVSTPKVEVDPRFQSFFKIKPNKSISKTAPAWEASLYGFKFGNNRTIQNDFSEVQFESDELQSSIFDEDEGKKFQNTFQLTK